MQFLESIRDRHTSRTAPNACISCSSLKRGCDRLIPVCGRCVRKNTICQYVFQEATQDQHRRRFATYSFYGFSALWVPHLEPPQQTRRIASHIGKRNELDLSLTSYLFDTMHKFNLGLDTGINFYTQSTHQWMPIVHPHSLRQKAALLQDFPCAELACFLLHILLVNSSMSSEFLSDRTLLMSLYEACKFQFLLLQNYRRDRLLTVQSGILLAIYEQGIGHSSDAYTSLASCTSLGYAMGLNRSSVNNLCIQDEQKLVWGVIYVLDRLFFHFNEKSARTCLVHSPQVGDALPIDDILRGYEIIFEQNVPTLTAGGGIATSHLSHQVQAVYILECVLQLTRAHFTYLQKNYFFWQLDQLIRHIVQSTLKASRTDLEHQYGIIVILLLALIELHKKRLMCLAYQGTPISTGEPSVIAIEVALGIIGDLAHVDNTVGILDVNRMPLAAVVLFQKAGTMAIWLKSFHNRDPLSVMQAISRGLERIRDRWIVADQIAEEFRVPHYQIPEWESTLI